MSDLIRDHKERRAMIAALWSWVDSQEIKHEHAAIVLVQLAGFFIGQHAALHDKDLETGLKLIIKILRKAANTGLEIKVDYD